MGAAASNFNLKTHPYVVENLAADADITGRAVFFFPQKGSFQAAYIHTAANSAGIDANNTAVFTLKISTKTVATLTRTSNVTADTQYSFTPAAAAADTPAYNSERTAGTGITLDVTQGTNADMPAFVLTIVWNQDGLAT